MIDIIKLIGKRGLSYQGINVEVAYTFNDPHIDHTNFFRTNNTLRKYKSLLNSPIDKVIKRSLVNYREAKD